MCGTLGDFDSFFFFGFGWFFDIIQFLFTPRLEGLGFRV